MPKENSFDVVSEIDLQEVDNAINNAIKEIRTRYDLKNSGSIIDFDRKSQIITLTSQDEYTLNNVYQVLESKAIKRNISPKAFQKNKLEEAFGGQAKVKIDIINGIPDEKIKYIVKKIKSSGLKVTPKIEGDRIRVFGKKRDILQEAIAIIKDLNLDIPVQFINYR